MKPAHVAIFEESRKDAFSPLVLISVFFSSLLFYVATLAPTVIWGDSAAYAIAAVQMKLAVGADSHPLFIALGHFFSFLPFEPAYSLNLLCAIIASLAVVTIYSIILRLTGSIFSALMGAISLLLSHAFWLHAVITAVRDFNVLFLALTILILLIWRENTERLCWLYLAVFVFALGLTNHLILGIESIGLIYFALSSDSKRVLKIKTLLLAAGSFLCGISLIIYLAARQFLTGTAATALVDSATGGQFKKAMGVFSWGLLRDLFLYFAYLFYQFPFLGFVLGIAGLIVLFKQRRRLAWTVLLLLGINAAFFISFGAGYRSTTKYTFYIPDYALFSILIGYGTCHFAEQFKRKGRSWRIVAAAGVLLIILCPVLTYNWAPVLAKSLKIDLLHAREIPFRDNEKFFLNPNKRGYDGADTYARTALSGAALNAVIIADHTPLAVLRYYQTIKKYRTDILLMSSGFAGEAVPRGVHSYYGKRDIYLAGLMPGYYRIRPLNGEFDFIPDGILYRVSARSGSDQKIPAPTSGYEAIRDR
jgi:hypothetical protein